MYIYKFTHMLSGRCISEGINGGWKRSDGGPMKGKTHPNKGGTRSLKGRTLTVDDGKRKWSSKI